MTADGRRVLQSTLEKLLGFDGVEDVLDHVLTIESSADLSEYLTQLLGGRSSGIDWFVDSVFRFRNGESLDRSEDRILGPKPESLPAEQEMSAFTAPSSSHIKLQTKHATSKESRRNRQNKGKISRVPPPKTSTNRTSPVRRDSEVPPTKIDQKSLLPTTMDETSPGQNLQQSRDRIGKAKSECGCFGTKHKPLTNCLYCGRISCELEGYDFCAFCGFMVEEMKDGPANGEEHVWIQKERLLRFDREFAHRTQVIDDQADFQQNATVDTN